MVSSKVVEVMRISLPLLILAKCSNYGFIAACTELQFSILCSLFSLLNYDLNLTTSIIIPPWEVSWKFVASGSSGFSDGNFLLFTVCRKAPREIARRCTRNSHLQTIPSWNCC